MISPYWPRNYWATRYWYERYWFAFQVTVRKIYHDIVVQVTHDKEVTVG